MALLSIGLYCVSKPNMIRILLGVEMVLNSANLAFIYFSVLGMVSILAEQGDFGPKKVALLAMKHRDVVVGVKTAHYMKPDWGAVDSALEAGKLAGIPVMVDFGFFRPERPYWRLVTERLRPGDISTHMFRGPVPWVDDNGKLLPYLLKAREKRQQLSMLPE